MRGRVVRGPREVSDRARPAVTRKQTAKAFVRAIWLAEYQATLAYLGKTVTCWDTAYHLFDQDMNAEHAAYQVAFPRDPA